MVAAIITSTVVYKNLDTNLCAVNKALLQPTRFVSYLLGMFVFGPLKT